jgi:hypothetical protein
LQPIFIMVVIAAALAAITCFGLADHPAPKTAYA